MVVNVTKERVVITEQSKVHAGDYLVHSCTFNLPEEFKGLLVSASFGGIKIPLVNGECYVPNLPVGNCVLGVYAYKENNGETLLMYSPKPTAFYVAEGSFKEENGCEEVPNIGEFESYCNQIAEIVANRDMTFEKTENKVNVIDDGNTSEAFPTAQAVKNYVEGKFEEDKPTNSSYRLIANFVLDEDKSEVVVSADIDNNPFTLKKVFLCIWGSMYSSRSDGKAIVQFRLDAGKIYQSYVTLNVNSGSGWWAESKKIGSVNDRSIWRSIYPTSLVSNAQGLLESNRPLASSWGYMSGVTGSSVHIGLRKIADSDSVLIKAGTRIMVFGADDE